MPGMANRKNNSRKMWKKKVKKLGIYSRSIWFDCLWCIPRIKKARRAIEVKQQLLNRLFGHCW